MSQGDAELRALQRRAAQGDPEAAAALRRRLIRTGQGYPSIQDLPRKKLEENGAWVNGFSNNQPYATFRAGTDEEVKLVFDFLLKWSLRDQHEELDTEPCFDFETGRPIGRQPFKEPMVSLFLIEGLDEIVTPEPEPPGGTYTSLNAYDTTEGIYGGPEEGGWYYTHHEPLACLSIDVLFRAIRDRRGRLRDQRQWPPYIREAYELMTTLYDGEDHRVWFEDSPPRRTPRPHYE